MGALARPDSLEVVCGSIVEEIAMLGRRPRSGWFLGLLLVGVAVAPAPAPPETEKSTELSALAKARYDAAKIQFEEVWTFYRQSRTESFPVYYWSRLVLDSERELSDKGEDKVAAAQAHLDRMRRLETLVKKVRRLGFGFSVDVKATEYYSLEAQYWLERAKND
jgi:hypothetical protein